MKYIEGELSIANKLWFNDSTGRCRLRICGFTEEQIKNLGKSSFIDITLIENKDEKHKDKHETFKALILISKPEKLCPRCSQIKDAEMFQKWEGFCKDGMICTSCATELETMSLDDYLTEMENVRKNKKTEKTEKMEKTEKDGDKGDGTDN